MVRMTGCIGLLATWMAVCPLDAGEKSDTKVKATATTTKAGNDGKQTVTITLEVDKGWYIYANPVGKEDSEPNKTNVAFTAKEKVVADVKYPTGKVRFEMLAGEKVKFNVYEGKVTIQAVVTRTMGDGSPLQISIGVNSCNGNVCLFPGKVKLTVP